MKKIIKLVVVSLMLVVMMTGLTGCRKFEELRQSQATLKDEETLVFHDEEYYLLPYCEYLNPNYGSQRVYLMPKDAPILLSNYMGDVFDMSEDKKFISGAYGNAWSYDEEVKIFCHEDDYDEIKAVIEKGYEPDSYKIEYYGWENDDMQEYIFSEKEAAAVETVLNTSPSEMYEGDWYQSCSLSSCIKGTPFSMYEVELIETDNGYYLEKYDEELETSVYYKVPTELNDIFEKIFAMAEY